MSNKLAVAEHFYSIQGEGKYMGVPAVFLRLSGCNLMCGGQGTQFDGELHNGATWRCDTLDVWMKGNSTPIDELIKTFHELGYIEHLKRGAHLVITGGEPLLQQDAIIDFLDTLKKETDLFVEIETNGTMIPKDELHKMVRHYNISPKLANSGNTITARYNKEAIQWFVKYDFLTTKSWKFVVGDEDDLEECIEYLGLEAWYMNRLEIFLMPPCENIDEYNAMAPKVAELCKKHTLNFSSRLQINIWDKTTGV